MKHLFTLFIAGLLSLSLTACSGGNLSANLDASNPSSFAGKCKQRGGKWTNGGILGLYGCLRQAKDAGKVCSDNKQCEYDCLASTSNPPSAGQSATGVCQTSNSYKGCRIEIKKGIAQPEFCIRI
uniref:Lipoprotein n=1 Tax=uncultured Thiotrichaceae bacterium TaxID=298394 RepID=A0A6S6U9U1_9GAMM|nr:MAG: Unknown protein [uncultured Thiotrichaceae bacterium]